MNNSFFFSHLWSFMSALAWCLFTCAAPIVVLTVVACNLVNYSGINSALWSMLLDTRNRSPVKFRLSEFSLRKPWYAAWKIQLVLLLAKMSELLPDSDFLLFFPSCIYIVLPLWFYEWNVMFCICIKVLSLGALSVLETFTDINLGEKILCNTWQFPCIILQLSQIYVERLHITSYL